MAINRGLATKRSGLTTIESLVVKLGYHFPSPYEISRGNVFYLATPDVSKDAQGYCVKDVKAPLLAYAEYWKLPNLSL